MDNKRTAYICLICACFFWGTTYFFIRIGVELIPPFLFAGIRHFVAGILITSFFIFYKKAKIPTFDILIKLFFIGLLLLVFANCFVTWAEVYIPSGLTSLLCCFVPFYMLIFNVIMKNNEPINKYSLLGLLLGLIGTVLIFSDNIYLLSNTSYTFGIILTVIANIAWALGTIFTKKIKLDISPLYSVGLQMIMIGFFVILFSYFFEDYDNLKFTQNGILSIVYLIIFGSIVGFGSYFYAVSKLPTTIISVNGYANVIVAMSLGTIFHGEDFGVKTILSLIITMIGIYLVNFGYKNQNS
ncbi:MAG: multidrug DMT transporter permease [Cytophagales bacterium]|nr:MAG: multidrug DMT transporter permease [Cytophagales bacterium]